MVTPVVLTADRICDLVGGELLGDAAAEVRGVAPLDRATPEQLSFVASRRYGRALAETAARAVLLLPEFRHAPGPHTRILVADPARALSLVLELMYPPLAPRWGIAPGVKMGRRVTWSGRIAIGDGTQVGDGTRFGSDCVLGTACSIGASVTTGDRCHIGAGVSIAGSVELGDDVVVHPGACLGAPGFGYVPGTSRHDPIGHVGRCVIGNGVRVGANTCIDRGSISDTVVGDGTKIDNLVQIGHNTRVGRRCFVMAQVGIAGSTVVEDDVILAGQAGLAGHLTVGRGARVAAQGGVIGDIPPGVTVSGYPARPHRESLRQTAALRRLTPLARRLETMARDDHRA